MKCQEMKKNLKWKTHWMGINSELEYITIETCQNEVPREKKKCFQKIKNIWR